MLKPLTSIVPLVSLLALAGCNTAPTATQTPSTPSTPTASQSPASASPIAQASTNPATQISADGIGVAKLGTTYGALKQALGEGFEYKVQSPFIVDFDAIAVERDGKTQFHILYLAGKTFSDSDVIQGLMTDNPDYKTEQGVGAGSLIREAEAAYGKATLSYNTANEGREYVRFARQPASNVSFSTGNGNAETAGIYPSSIGEFNETEQYRPDAKIQSVLVVCLGGECSQQE